MSDRSRIEELRLRIQKEPASIAFAQLAEEYRRAGRYEDSVGVCRVGLTKHPTYLSARVTLGRSLLELGQLSEAQQELERVLSHAPENLTATRCLGEIHRRQGSLVQALDRFRAALELAPNDPELEQTVGELTRRVGVSQISSPQPEDSFDSEMRLSQADRSGPSREGESRYDRSATMLTGAERARALATMAALEQWLAAIYVTRPQRHA